jgi:hypothetical protein
MRRLPIVLAIMIILTSLVHAQAKDDTRSRVKQLVVGMTGKQVMDLMGEPSEIIKTTISSGTHENWIYNDIYVYITNGTLTSWQDEGNPDSRKQQK